MFWKKKTAEPPRFNLDGDSQRLYFRAAPQEPVALWINGQPATLVDISAGGLAAVGQNWTAGDRVTVRLHLPLPAAQIAATMCIVDVDVDVDAANVCHGRFTEIDPGAVEAIHRYVLEVQKNRIRSGRRNKTPRPKQR